MRNTTSYPVPNSSPLSSKYLLSSTVLSLPNHLFRHGTCQIPTTTVNVSLRNPLLSPQTWHHSHLLCSWLLPAFAIEQSGIASGLLGIRYVLGAYRTIVARPVRWKSCCGGRVQQSGFERIERVRGDRSAYILRLEQFLWTDCVGTDQVELIKREHAPRYHSEDAGWSRQQFDCRDLDLLPDSSMAGESVFSSIFTHLNWSYPKLLAACLCLWRGRLSQRYLWRWG